MDSHSASQAGTRSWPATLLQYFVLSTNYFVQSTNRSPRLPLLALVTSLLAAPALSAQDSSASLTPGVHLAPQAFREATAKARPSIVRIEGFGGVASAKTGGYAAPGEAPTTGLVISADGHIITSTFNFLRQPPVITVVRTDGQRHVAQLLGRDETRKV